jgi:hypothetical protein
MMVTDRKVAKLEVPPSLAELLSHSKPDHKFEKVAALIRTSSEFEEAIKNYALMQTRTRARLNSQVIGCENL